MSNKPEARHEITIERLKELAGINDGPNHPRAIVFIPADTDVALMKNLVDKLKEIDGSVGEIWTDFDVGEIKYRATGITHDKPTNS
jgi:hypothetical protein